MNKTININLGGFFFHIDEVAYMVLKRYLESIARSLSDDPQGKNEIISDIESRISELLSEKITDERQVINEGDINDIIKIMGQPEDYADTEEGYSENSNFYQKKPSRNKKLYRDGEDKFLGGVASGISHYFDIDSIWVRLFFIIFSGIGIPAYIILWILLPEARTTAEKLEMDGEQVNIDNIERKIRNEFENVSDKIKNADFSKAKSGFQDFLDVLGKIILSVFKFIGKFIGILLMFISAIVLIAFIVGGFSIGSFEILGISEDYVNYPAFFYDSIFPLWSLTIFAAIAIGFPFLILFVLGLRIISSKVKQFSKPTSLSLLGIWIISILVWIFIAIEYNSSRAVEGSKINHATLELTAVDTLQVKLVNDENLNFKHSLQRNYNHEIVYIDDIEKTYSNNIRVGIKASENGEAKIKIRRESEGKNRNRAIQNADKINYNYKISNNTISLDGYFIGAIENMYKDENVTVTLYLPVGVPIHFTESTRSFLYNIYNTQHIRENDMANQYFIMTKEGLECTDCDEKLFRN